MNNRRPCAGRLPPVVTPPLALILWASILAMAASLPLCFVVPPLARGDVVIDLDAAALPAGELRRCVAVGTARTLADPRAAAGTNNMTGERS